MSRLRQLAMLLGKYTNLAQDQFLSDEDYDLILKLTLRPHIISALVETFKSPHTPPFDQMVAGLYVNSPSRLKADVFNACLSAAPAVKRALDPIMRSHLKRNKITAKHAQRISIDAVLDIAARAEKFNPAVVERISKHYADHLDLLMNMTPTARKVMVAAIGGGQRGEPPPEPPGGGPRKTASYVNFKFEDLIDPSAPRELQVHEGFHEGCRYRLTVSMDLEPDVRFREPGQQPEVTRPEISETINLDVAVIPNNDVEVIGEPLDVMEWPAKGPSLKNAQFRLEAKTGVAKPEVKLDVYIYHELNLLFTARLNIGIIAADEEWELNARPIKWDVPKDVYQARSYRFRWFSELKALGKRDLSLAIQRGEGPDEYIFTACIGAAAFPARAQLSKEELGSYLLETRKLMDELRRNPVYVEEGFDPEGNYIGAYTGKVYKATGDVSDGIAASETFEKFRKQMAVAGSRFWHNLFNKTASGKRLNDIINRHLSDGSVIQIWIDKEARDFIYPWSWIYNDHVNPGRRFTVRNEHFWGYKYIIEQIPEFVETIAECPAQNPIPSETSLRLRMGVFEFERATENQRAFFVKCSGRSQGILNQEVWDEYSDWNGYLPQCDSQILYFFSHGHTALPITSAGLQQYNMVKALKEWIERPSDNEGKLMKDYRQRMIKELADSSDHSPTYIKLNDATLGLAELGNLKPKEPVPLVFLNMCESAQVFPTMTEGLVDVFLKNRSRLVIGTEMPMLSHFADLFARKFFERFFYGMEGPDNKCASVGRILFDLRREFMGKKNPLGFAYTLFGNATTRLSRQLPGKDTNHSTIPS